MAIKQTKPNSTLNYMYPNWKSTKLKRGQVDTFVQINMIWCTCM